MTLTVLLIFLAVSAFMAVVIWGLVAVMDLLGSRTPAVAPVAAAPAVATASATTDAAGPRTSVGHPARHIAAISAAVAAVFDDQAVVVHIESAHGPHAGGWAAEGRYAHHGSHNVGHGHR